MRCNRRRRVVRLGLPPLTSNIKQELDVSTRGSFSSIFCDSMFRRTYRCPTKKQCAMHFARPYCYVMGLLQKQSALEFAPVDSFAQPTVAGPIVEVRWCCDCGSWYSIYTSSTTLSLIVKNGSIMVIMRSSSIDAALCCWYHARR